MKDGQFSPHAGYPAHYSLYFILLIASILLAAMPVGIAFAGDCDDGTPGDDSGPDAIQCIADPVVPDAVIGLGLGDDTFTQDAGVFTDAVFGDSLEDGDLNTGDGGNDDINVDGFSGGVVGDFTDGNGGNDTITINGNVSSVHGDLVTGNGGNDTIAVNGLVDEVIGDLAVGDGGDDTIIINGIVNDVVGDDVLGNGGNDTIIINGTVSAVVGDDAVGNGGDDLIIINGTVTNNVTGDCADLDGGDDTIIINGTVGGDVLGDCVAGAGGNDTVTLGENAIVVGIIDGEGGTDALEFEALTQAQLDAMGLDPAGGNITIGGNTYTWLNFESLIGLLIELAEELAERGLRIFFSSAKLLAVEAESHAGINIFAEHGRVAYIPFDSLDSIPASGQTYQTPNSAGWHVTVFDLGADPVYKGHRLYQVNIYTSAGALAGQFTFLN